MIYSDSDVFIYCAKERVVGQTEKGLEITIAEQCKTVWVPKEHVSWSGAFGGGWTMPLWLARDKGLDYDPDPAGNAQDDAYGDFDIMGP